MIRIWPVFPDFSRQFLRQGFLPAPGFASAPVQVAPAQIQLLTAALDLQLVQLLRQAIRTADLSSGKGALGSANAPGQSVGHPADRFESRKVIHPQTRIEPRLVMHPQPRVELPTRAIPTEVEPVRIENRTIPPVWKQVFWKCEAKPPVQIKLIRLKPDVQKRGTLIDLFM